MLTFVGMLNYMGNGEMPQNVCGGTQLDEQFVDSSPLMTAINEEEGSQTMDRLTNDWSLDKAFEPNFDEYDFIGDLMPANPDSIASLDLSLNKKDLVALNIENTPMTLQDAFATSFDMRESFLQRHAASPLTIQAEATELVTKEFSTKSFNMWKSNEEDMVIYPDANTANCGSSSSTDDSSIVY